MTKKEYDQTVEHAETHIADVINELHNLDTQILDLQRKHNSAKELKFNLIIKLRKLKDDVANGTIQLT